MPDSTPVILKGFAAAILGGITLWGWASLGSLLISELEDGPVEPFLFSLLLGSSVSAFLLSTLCALGCVQAAVWLGFSLPICSIFIAGKRSGRAVASLCNDCYPILNRHKPFCLIISIIAIISFFDSMAAPRDGDVMRYHLAHIRQIIQDGRWVFIPDVHYAFPFGWSFCFLPFERIGLPETAHMLNFGLWILIIATLTRTASSHGSAAVSILPALLLTHPMVLKMATTAHADMLLIFTACLVAQILVDSAPLPPTSATCFALGFTSWVGLQSRYQAAAIGIAAAAAAMIKYRQSTRAENHWGAYLAGSFFALSLCLPFLAMNALGGRNPFWPIFSSFQEPIYANRVASSFLSTFNGNLSFHALAHGVSSLLGSIYVFPLPLLSILILVVCTASLTARSSSKAPLVFIGGYYLVWALSQPTLYSRFILPLIPILSLLLTLNLPEFFAASRPLPTVRWLTAIAFMSLVGNAAYSVDLLRYVVTGNSMAYHRYTNYYPAYQWIDSHTPRDARFLVIIRSGQSYYLNRAHRRADPILTGEIDWQRMTTTDDLISLLHSGHFTHILWNDTDWSRAHGGDRMVSLMRSAVESGDLKEIVGFNQEIFITRWLRKSMKSRVLIYAVSS
ncbi:MAG TPA: hypothetical protein DCM05_11940 [Elusimicrobia bacterium]|nr:hypothetical protein [Elusimicrobiota bacterium]